MDPVGAFAGPDWQLEATPFLAFPESGAKAWSPTSQWGYRGQLHARWFDLQPDGAGRFLTVGSIADTVLFTGEYRIWYGGKSPDSTDWLDHAAVLAGGGGGGVGIGIWSDSGMKLRLLRFGEGVTWPLGWQVLPESDGFTMVGRFESPEAGWVWDGVDSFSYAATPGTCFVYRKREGAGSSWWSDLPCPARIPSEIVRTGSGLWATFNDSVRDAGSDPSGLSWCRGIRPGLERLDPSTGLQVERLHPLGDMQGIVRALASDERGSLLLQGEQSSIVRLGQLAFPPVLDTLVGQGELSSITAGWLALVDSSGTLRRFRQLHGLENVGGWKIRHAPGIGWVALSYDDKDFLGWSRLYLFDDTLGVIDSSPRLPQAMDVELGNNGDILLSGVVGTLDSSTTWLRGTGSMWVASCRLGAQTPTGVRSPSPTRLSLRRHGRTMVVTTGVPGAIRLRAYGVEGRIVLDRWISSGSTVDLPRGVATWFAQQGSMTATLRTVGP